MAEVRLPGYAQAVRMLASGRLLDDAEKLAVPTHVVVGERDAVTPPENAERLFGHLSAATAGTLSIVPDAGHALSVEAPEAVATSVRAMMDGGGAEEARRYEPKEVHHA